ncbi:hypothetical protein [Parabacteroides distasonis]|uniref:hypothetical protein n=1 Tax=Parabacteroides distasonis TaxID=823 RepID=UPI0018AC4EBE|nr:hypothetical protein [Parabacteroides distasonis]MDB9026989.1 hypothetical protein [Parabacteroides distasonis]MDB9043816.1 hypothetical protein [Parabacteroides distasonis]MDB9093247.1 hypothetical protein [Parabacteroides distasonis]MDB9161818.1 hypothetical protein [Parabacteroides distasonis]
MGVVIISHEETLERKTVMRTEENILPGIRKIKQSDYCIFDTLHYIWRKRTNTAVKYPNMVDYRKRMGGKRKGSLGVAGYLWDNKKERINLIF